MGKSRNIVLTFLIFGIIFLSDAQIIKIDTYPVSKEMLKDNINSNNIGDVYTLDQVWFTNDTLNETIIFELDTDYHRFITYHFKNDQIPTSILKEIVIYTKDGKSSNIPISDSLKTNYLPKLVGSSTKIDSKYFLSELGHYLGENKDLSMELYGKPNSISKIDEYKILRWNFEADPNYIGSESKIQRYALGSFGYELTMIYVNGKLIGRIIMDDIP